jgi:golgi SNAP receptor complex member 1
MASREGILHDRSVLTGITTKLKAVGQHFPQISQVINAVQKRKSRDQMIIAAVVAFCCFLTFYYLFLGD